MDSISSLTQKHCRCATNIICGILLVLLSAINITQTAFAAHPVYIICSSAAAIAALFMWIYIIGFKTGCSLMQIPLIITTAISFFAALPVGAIGFIIVGNNGAEAYINSVLDPYGYQLAIEPYLIGISLIAGAILLLTFAFCTFTGISYFNSIKSCLNGKIKQSGAKLFGIISMVLFALIGIAIIAYTVFLFSTNQLEQITSDNFFGTVYLEIIITDLLLLFIGISAISFSRQIHEFNAFENQMMKVETNADGTVYVPLNDDFEFVADNADSSTLSAKTDTKKKRKPFIKEVSPSENFSSTEKKQTLNEQDII